MKAKKALRRTLKLWYLRILWLDCIVVTQRNTLYNVVWKSFLVHTAHSMYRWFGWVTNKREKHPVFADVVWLWFEKSITANRYKVLMTVFRLMNHFDLDRSGIFQDDSVPIPRVWALVWWGWKSRFIKTPDEEVASGRIVFVAPEHFHSAFYKSLELYRRDK